MYATKDGKNMNLKQHPVCVCRRDEFLCNYINDITKSNEFQEERNDLKMATIILDFSFFAFYSDP